MPPVSRGSPPALPASRREPPCPCPPVRRRRLPLVSCREVGRVKPARQERRGANFVGGGGTQRSGQPAGGFHGRPQGSPSNPHTFMRTMVCSNNGTPVAFRVGPETEPWVDFPGR